jgi:signal transduction histidine kinase
MINRTIYITILTIIFLIYLIIKIYKGYTFNLRERILAQDKVKVLSHQRQSLIHVLCHDLGNPISAIFSLTQVGHLLPEQEKLKMIETIQENAQSSLDIIELTRKMQALEIGKLSVDIKGVNLKNSFEKSLKILSERIESKKILIEVEIPDSIEILADETSLINSIFSNILTNSIKFSNESGLVKVSVNTIHDNIIMIIRDFGVGIPKDILQNIFSESFETSRVGTNGEIGTGFGMPLVKKFIDAYGGSIEVVSTTEGTDTGTTSILTFKSA